MAYLNWDTKILPSSAEANTDANIEAMYDQGYVFGRVDKGMMNKTRSFRINLKAFEMSSENRRILRKAEHLSLSVENIPYSGYSWEIGKLAKDFYEKFGDNVFTANKTKEIITEADKTNFNKLFIFRDSRLPEKSPESIIGYVIVRETAKMIHYSYPFYVESDTETSRGLGMMTKAIEWAKASSKEYIYLGSLQRSSDTYKLQFAGSEWFDGENWQFDTTPLREILKN